MGVAIASGMSPMAGMVTGIIGGLVVGLIAGSPLQDSGPAASLTVLIWQLVLCYGAARCDAAGDGGINCYERRSQPSASGRGKLAGKIHSREANGEMSNYFSPVFCNTNGLPNSP